MIQADDKGFIVFTRRNTRDRQLILSSNPFLLFRYFKWRRIGQPISDRHFDYLSTLSRNSKNGFELSELAKIKEDLE